MVREDEGTHPGGIVTTGRLTVQVGFETAVLGPGDSIAFDSVVPHRFWNETPDEVRAVWFILDSPRSGAESGNDTASRSSAHQTPPGA